MAMTLEDMQKISKENIEAATASASTLTKGVQEIAAEAAEYSKASLEETTKVLEKLFSAKTVEAALAIQTEYAKSAYDGFVAKATKFSDLYTSLAKEAYKPVEEALAKVQAAGK